MIPEGVVVNSGKLLCPYLRQNRGISMLHSLATGQGSDYRDNDPALEPLVEIYQGNALAKGYKLGAQSSSDHVSTQCSCALIYTPSIERGAIVESMRQRHACAATDNIILDFRAVDAQGREHMMGDAFESTVEFAYVDNNPGGEESHYYVRAIEIDRNLVWSSPIWVKYGR